MKRLLLLSMGILLCASIAFGQAGFIGLYEDPTYVDCDLSDVGPGVKNVYVVHKATPGATASQWMIVNNGNLCTYIAESSPYIVIGNAFVGISVAYGGCWPSDNLLLNISYFCSGITPPCNYLEVVGDPASPTGQIEVVDCAATKLIGSGSILTINSNGTCDCGEIIPVQDTSWGKIKSMY